ncbi:hypothetical protein [Gulosibacter sp. ACHW.36C]|uniref:Histidine kinase n=1 Tax=Gulosibacter sediminis TaxID=1729695 RepID=A0ABY4MXV1_9MICO|nr:hypothetical protein [Gulosibacter sediminis]UQN15260.1 hypothetical protein M3M28_01950 [Gulosibacter sediminis]
MNAEGEHPTGAATTGPVWPLILLAMVLGLEALVMAWVTVLLFVEFFAEDALSVASSIALIVMAGLATVLLIALTVGVCLGQRWVRGLTAVWQALQVAAAVTVIRGDMMPGLGWALAVASLVGLLLVFHPAVSGRLK